MATMYITVLINISHISQAKVVYLLDRLLFLCFSAKTISIGRCSYNVISLPTSVGSAVVSLFPEILVSYNGF